VINRYNMAEDSMEPDEAGTWVPFDEVERLLGERTLRDYFAGQALAGMMANGFQPDEAHKRNGIGARQAFGRDTYVAAAYRLADAMLSERAK